MTDRPAILLPIAYHYRDEGLNFHDTCHDVDPSWRTSDDNGITISNAMIDFQYYHDLAAKMSPIRVLRECIEACAEKGLVYEGIKWSDVALFPMADRTLKASFVDVTWMSRRDSVNECYAEMYTYVKDNLHIDLTAK